MPFIFNFEDGIAEPITVEVEPKGWVGPVKIEYVVAQAHKYDTSLSVVWRVCGTTHSFTIPERNLNSLSNGDYKKHFTEALEGFRKDYISWFTDKEYEKADWKYEYAKQFRNFILPDEVRDTESQSK